MRRSLLRIALLFLGALTAAALWQGGGVRGIVGWHVQSFGVAQVFTDLVIALLLAMAWMYQDARAIGRTAWPWMIATLALGSFGPLIYLLARRPRVSAA